MAEKCSNTEVFQVRSFPYLPSHENKKAFCPSCHKKIFLIENECVHFLSRIFYMINWT